MDMAMRYVKEYSAEFFRSKIRLNYRIFFDALDVKYAQLFQGFVKDDKLADNYAKYLKGEAVCKYSGEIWSRLWAPVEACLRLARSTANYKITGALVEEGVLGVAQANAIILHAARLNNEVQNMWKVASKTHDVVRDMASAYDFITIPSSINPDEGIFPSSRAQGHVVFEDVYFQYPTRDTMVLKGVSFKAMAGDVIGITGAAGCGKSTALELLQRFYDVSSGQIMLDGRDIREYSPRWLRSQIIAVGQEPQLIQCSNIRDNLIVGCETEPTLEEIQKACEAANIWETLSDANKFPHGLLTYVSNASKTVSGGEKQRICIARAILANPAILLLDEATSALDEENQRLVQGALNKLMEGRTTFVIAHRLSTIRGSSKILAFDDGKVKEEGRHDELIKLPDGIYSALWRQSMGEDAAPPPPPIQRSTSTEGKFAMLRRQLEEAKSEKDFAAVKDDVCQILQHLEDESQQAEKEIQNFHVDFFKHHAQEVIMKQRVLAKFACFRK